MLRCQNQDEEKNLIRFLKIKRSKLLVEKMCLSFSSELWGKYYIAKVRKPYTLKKLLYISLTTDVKYPQFLNVMYLVLLQEGTRAKSDTVWQGLSRKLYLSR